MFDSVKALCDGVCPKHYKGFCWKSGEIVLRYLAALESVTVELQKDLGCQMLKSASDKTKMLRNKAV